jgi:hypothetical protein
MPNQGPLFPPAPPEVVVPPTPWFRWPPDKQVWAGGASGIFAWILLSLLQHFLGFDPQMILVSIMGTGAPDVQAITAGLVALLVAHWTTPAARDVIDRVTNRVVELANATPTNPTTAAIVSEPESDAITMAGIRAGALPPEIIKQVLADPPV